MEPWKSAHPESSTETAKISLVECLGENLHLRLGDINASELLDWVFESLFLNE